MPVVTLNYSNTVIVDTHISQASPTTIADTAATIQFGVDANVKLLHGLIKFDLGLIPNDAIINSATLNLYHTSVTGVDGRANSLHKITSDWAASVNWNTRPTFDPSAVLVKAPTVTGFNAYDIKSLVQAWVNGTAQNFGLLLRDADESFNGTVRASIPSNNNGTAANRPTLTIDYTIPTTGKKQVEYVGGRGYNPPSQVNSITVPLPSGVQTGDLLLANVIAFTNDSPLQAPAGWTVLREAKPISGTSYRYLQCYKFAGVGEVNPQFTNQNGSSTTAWGAMLQAFRNVKAVRENYNNSYTTSGSSRTAPAAVTAYDDTLAVLSLVHGVNGGAATFPLSFTEDVDYSTGSYHVASAHKYMYTDKDLATSETTITITQTSTSEVFLVFLEPITNNPPTLTLTNPADNQTLTEGNALAIQGTATDPDANDSVTVKCRINGGTIRNIGNGISDGSSAISFARNLTFSGDRLYDGTTDVSGPLAEGVQHKIEVWAEDGNGGSSAIASRSFTVHHNDGPTITVDPFTPTQSGLIEPDMLSLSGSASDPDGNTVTVTGKMNNGPEQTLLSGVSSGNWTFAFPVSSMLTGANTVTITATDQFGAKNMKTFSLNKTDQRTPLTTGVARYKVLPPLGSAKEILAWLKREIGDLSVDTSVSFADPGQPESYISATKKSVDLTTLIAEDEFIATVASPKQDIVFMQTFTRTDANSPEAATSLVGVME